MKQDHQMLASLAVFDREEHQAFRQAGHLGCAVLVHGFPGTPAEMRPIAKVLNAEGWAVSAPLLPGFGADLESLPNRSYQDWLQAIRTEISLSRKQYGRVILLGHSMGGALAARLAAEEKILGLILLAPFWKLPGFLWQAIPLLRFVFPTFRPFRLFKPDFSDEKTQEAIRNFMPDADLTDPQIQTAILDFAIPMKIIDQIRIAGNEAYRAASLVECPTLVIQGTLDTLVKPEMTEKFIRRFPKGVEYCRIEATHELHQPEAAFWSELAATVRDFARRQYMRADNA